MIDRYTTGLSNLPKRLPSFKPLLRAHGVPGSQWRYSDRRALTMDMKTSSMSPVPSMLMSFPWFA